MLVFEKNYQTGRLAIKGTGRVLHHLLGYFDDTIIADWGLGLNGVTSSTAFDLGKILVGHFVKQKAVGDYWWFLKSGGSQEAIPGRLSTASNMDIYLLYTNRLANVLEFRGPTSGEAPCPPRCEVEAPWPHHILASHVNCLFVFILTQ